MLRRDIPTHLLCDFCQTFHLKPPPKTWDPAIEWMLCPKALQKGMRISWPKFGVYLQFPEVQMVMNRHRWGDPHGTLLSSIAISTDWKPIKIFQRIPFVCKFDLEPAFIEGNLTIYIAQRLFFTRRQIEHETEAFGTVRDSTAVFKACKHVAAFTEMFLTIYWLCKDRHHMRFDPGWNMKRYELQVCQSCNTCWCLEAIYHGDWSASMTPAENVWHPPADGFELTLHSWKPLGTCEHTFSPSWLILAEQREPDTPIYPDHTVVKARKIALETFMRIMLPEVQKAHSQMNWSQGAMYHRSFLPAIDRAVAIEDDPFTTKHHELTNILRAARYKVGRFDMDFLVHDALGIKPEGYDHGKLKAAEKPKHVRTAMKIIEKHKRNPTGAGFLKRLLGSRVYNKLPGVLKKSHSK
jgi:hypothetical protein